MDKPAKIFADGVYFEKPREGSPEWIKGRISLFVPRLIPFVEAHKNDKGYLNLDLKKSKEGKLYLELNTYQTNKLSDGEATISPDDF